MKEGRKRNWKAQRRSVYEGEVRRRARMERIGTCLAHGSLFFLTVKFINKPDLSSRQTCIGKSEIIN